MFKRTAILGTLLVAGLAFATGPALAKTTTAKPPFDFSGAWSSSYGDMRVAQTGASFTGSYPSNHGRFAATVTDNVAHGVWAQSTGAVRCGTMKLNSYYWGKLEFIGQPGERRFEGSWSYCDGAYSGPWEGKRP